ncbi:MAG: hypothetical protein IT373_09950 [Polyangiaceae bacterium]|nr:hypothetical protein [Polyangiaceae bacterium]
MKRPGAWSWLVLGLGALGCASSCPDAATPAEAAACGCERAAAARAPVAAPSASAPSAPLASSAAPLAAEPTAVASASGPAPAPAPEAVPTVKLRAFRRELAEPVRSLAIGKPRIAAYGARVWLREGGAFKEVPLPASFRAAADEREDARIFFGRDDRPRIMGERTGPGGGRPVYLRFKDAWTREKKELARLAGEPQAPLYGVLGHEDPEVVCKVSDLCIVKRRTGWTSFPAEAAPLRIELSGGAVWAVAPGRLLRLGEAGFAPVAASCPYGAPGGVAATPDGTVWVSEPGKDLVHRFAGGSWQSGPSPIAGPRGLYAAGPGDVWLVGDGGVAHHDGAGWARIEGPTGPLAEVRASGAELWLAGESGVWRAGP